MEYISSDDRYQDYQGDEIFLDGLYDFEITTPAVPAGTYEVRFGYLCNGDRGKAQLYFDGVPCGIPLDLNKFPSDPSIGYVRPGTDYSDPEGYDNDRSMKNRGFMKGPAIFQQVKEDWYQLNARTGGVCLRRILGTYTFEKDGTHKLKAKAARSGAFMFDYIEFVPLEEVEKEDIY